MTAFRSLALLAADRNEDASLAVDLTAWREALFDLPYLRTIFLDTLRLWPTTPVLLRQATRKAMIGDCEIPRETNIIIYIPFFHRDGERVSAFTRDSLELVASDQSSGSADVPFATNFRADKAASV